jgi:hypothetical protein
VTAPAASDVTPLTGDLTWLEAYGEARASMRWEIVDPANAASRLSMPWPHMARIYDGMALADPEPEPERPSRWERLKARLR